MKEITIFFLLVLFELRSYGHSLSNVETSSEDKYKVREGNSSLTIISPKAEKPTLREIIYYHIIERPYEEHKVNDDITERELPDTDITRPITNGHGYQFLDNYIPDDKNTATNTTPDIDVRFNDDHSDDTIDKISYYEELAIDDDLTSYKGVRATNGETQNYDDEDMTPTITDIDESEQLQVQPEVRRRKRNIDYSKMPPAPQLPAFRIDVLPTFIKNLIFQEPETQEFVPAQYLEDEFEEQIDNLEEVLKRTDKNIDIKGKTYGMRLAGNSGDVWSGINKAPYFYHVGESEVVKETKQEDETFYPKIDQRIGYKSEEDKVIDTELKNIERLHEESTTHSFEGNNKVSAWKLTDRTTEKTILKDNATQKRQGRTYGMSLTGDSGTVWNDLDDDVGEPETLTSTIASEESTPVSEVATIETTQKPNDNTTTSLASDEEHAELDSREIEKSMKEIESLFEEMTKNSTRNPEGTTESNKVSENPNTDIKEHTTEASNIGTPKPDQVTEEPDSKGNEVDKTEDNKGSINDKKDQNKNSTMIKDEKSKQQEFVRELIKNKYFWEWVKESSKEYLEILMKEVGALISAEVKKQIDQYIETHKDDIVKCKPEDTNKNSTAVIKPIETNNVTTPKENTNATIDEANPKNDKNITAIPKNPSLNKSEDGNDTFKKHKDEKTDAKKSELVRIEAQNIYGNSVGNAKVMNIFIFNVSNTSDLSNVIPLNNGTNGVYVFGVDDQKGPNSNAGSAVENVTTITEQSTVSTIETVSSTTTEKNIRPETSTENVDISTTNKVSTTAKVDTSTTDIIEVSTETEKDTTSEKITSTSGKPDATTTENINEKTIAE